MKQPSKEQLAKMLTIVGVLPTKGMDLQTSDQQIALQRAFRQWMNEAFKLDEE